MKFTFWDCAAWGMNGLIVGLMIWFVHASYKSATQFGYTPEARAHMDYLAEIYNGDRAVPTDPIALKVEYLTYFEE